MMLLKYFPMRHASPRELSFWRIEKLSVMMNLHSSVDTMYWQCCSPNLVMDLNWLQFVLMTAVVNVVVVVMSCCLINLVVFQKIVRHWCWTQFFPYYFYSSRL